MTARELRLRRADTCTVCLTSLDVGTVAVWDSGQRTVTCVSCSDAVDTVANGTPGASARAEAARRRVRQAERLEREVQERPVLGRLKHVLAPEADAGRSWEVGAAGEERLGTSFDCLVGAGVLMLHDRRIPKSTANIDHMAVTPSGVWVIDAKRYQGRLAKVDKGGWFRTDLRLMVGGRDRSKLLAGVHKQVARVEQALAPAVADGLRIRGALCFIDTELGWFQKPFELNGVLVTWGKPLRQRLVAPGPIEEAQRREIHRALASAFPPMT